MSSIKDSIFSEITPKDTHSKSRSKVTVVGVGAVGMAAAFSIMQVSGEVVLIDVVENKVKGEILDLQHGQQFLQRCKVYGGSDYKLSENSDIVVVTAGARQNEGESRLSLVQKNVTIFQSIIPQIAKYSPNCVLVIVSNPVDILTYVASKISGFPKHRVIGSGTMLDSARFRYLLGEKLNVSASSIHAYIVGEHGDTSVPIWSSMNIGGVRISSYHPEIGTDKDTENFSDIHKQVINSAYEIIKLKGYTSWAIGLTCRTLCNAILYNLHSVYPLSIPVKGMHGITEDVYLSLPCLVTSLGVSHAIKQELNARELAMLKGSAQAMQSVINNIKW